MQIHRPTAPRRGIASALASEWKLFKRHKKWLIVLALGSFLLGLYEQNQVGWTSESMAGFTLNGHVSKFFYTNALNLLLWLYVTLKLLSKFPGANQVVAGWAIAKGCLTYFIWLALVVWAAAKLVAITMPDINNPGHFRDWLTTQPPLLLWALFAMLLVLFAYLQSVANITMAGTVLRRHFNTAAKGLPAIIARHLPVSALFFSVRMPVITLCLLVILLFKFLTGWLGVLGLPFVHLISEPLAQLALLFTVQLTYSLCADPHYDPAYQRYRHTGLTMAPARSERV